MSDKSHAATTPAEWAICCDREMRIQIFNMQPFFNVQSFATAKRRRKGLRCHDSICWMLPPQIGTCKAQGMKLDKRSDDWLTVLHMAQGQCFAYCGVSWKFVACPCLRNFHGATTAAAWINCPGITFHITAEIISFSTEFSSLTEVRQITFWGAKSKFVAASEER